jgi:hypothetical protein
MGEKALLVICYLLFVAFHCAFTLSLMGVELHGQPDFNEQHIALFGEMAVKEIGSWPAAASLRQAVAGKPAVAPELRIDCGQAVGVGLYRTTCPEFIGIGVLPLWW